LADFAGIIVFPYVFFSYPFRAMGNSCVPLLFLAVSTGLDIVLGIWLVMGLNMGVGRATWTAMIARATVGAVIAAYAMVKLRILRGILSVMVWNFHRIWETVVINDVATGSR